jgi:predicted secreted protein
MRSLLNGSAYKLVYLDVNHRSDNAMQDEFANVVVSGFNGNHIERQTIAGGKSVIRVQVTSTIEITP